MRNFKTLLSVFLAAAFVVVAVGCNPPAPPVDVDVTVETTEEPTEAAPAVETSGNTTMGVETPNGNTTTGAETPDAGETP